MASSPLIIGHRGASAKAPENTIAAFQVAIDAGADGIEFDVRLSRDGVPVVIHDQNLKRTGGINHRVVDLTLADLKQIDIGSWFNAFFSKERIPTLEELFSLFEPTNHVLYLEMKCDPTERDQLAQSCCDLLQRSSVKNRVIVECFDLQGIAAIKNIDCDIKTAALFEPSLRVPPSLPVGRGIVNQAIAVKADELALHHRLVNRRLLDAATKANLGIAVWTVDNPDWVKRASAQNIKALITNDPAAMVRQREIEGHFPIRVE